MDTLGAGPSESPLAVVRVSRSPSSPREQSPVGHRVPSRPPTPSGRRPERARHRTPGAAAQIKNGVLDPTPIGPMPEMLATGLAACSTSRCIRSRQEPADIDLVETGPGAVNSTTAVMRARWDGGSTLADAKDILVADAYHGGPGSPRGLGPASGS